MLSTVLFLYYEKYCCLLVHMEKLRRLHLVTSVFFQETKLDPTIINGGVIKLHQKYSQD